jgi:hypothetical protein
MTSDDEQVYQTTQNNKGIWTCEQDDALCNAIDKYGTKNWKKVAEAVPGRTDTQCFQRWQKVLNPELVKGPWSEEEDNKVRELVGLYGARKWSFIAEHLPGRIGKQCRERWTNHLDPGVKKGNWSQSEDELIIKLQRQHGNKWAKIASYLSGRTDNAVKNRFHSTISRRMRQQARKEKVTAIKSRVTIHDENNLTVGNSLPISNTYHINTRESQILRSPLMKTKKEKRVPSTPLRERNTSYSTITSLPSIHTFPVLKDAFDESHSTYISPTQTTMNLNQFSSPKLPVTIPQTPLFSSPLSTFSPLSFEKKRKQSEDSEFILTYSPKKSKLTSINCSPLPPYPEPRSKSARTSVHRRLDLDQTFNLPDFNVFSETTFPTRPPHPNTTHNYRN